MERPEADPRIRELEDDVERLSARVEQLQAEHAVWAQMEKEAAIGRLARGVAHEINNPLQGVLGFVQLLIQNLRSGDVDRQQALQNLEWIESSALRCKRVVDALLDFSTRDDGAPRTVDILGLLELNLLLLESELGRNGSVLETKMPDAPMPVEGNPTQLAQAVFNVLANARDAVEQGGTVRVEVAATDDAVTVAVLDDGPGIQDADLLRVFDPFFSTKEVGQGTGLGLGSARGIVRAHGGDIRVWRRDEGGTCVEMSLPRAGVSTA